MKKVFEMTEEKNVCGSEQIQQLQNDEKEWDLSCFSCFNSSDHLPLRSPLIDAEETEEEILIKIEIPGIKKEDIKLTADKDSITIRGEKKDSKETNEKICKNQTSYYSERRYAGFERSIALPTEINPDNIDAQYVDGILQLKITKIKKENKKEIKIR